MKAPKNCCCNLWFLVLFGTFCLADADDSEACWQGWILRQSNPQPGFCYRELSGQFDFQAALDSCERIEGKLLAATEPHKSEIIISSIKKVNASQSWAGIVYLNNKSISLDGTRSKWTNWMESAPRPNGSYAVIKSDGKWRAANSSDTTVPVIVCGRKPVVCNSADWFVRKDRCFKLFTERVSWGIAQKRCTENQANLAVPDKTEITRMINMNTVWIGLTFDPRNNIYQLINGTKASFKGKNWKATGNCVVFSKKLERENCSSLHNFLCEKGPYKDVQSVMTATVDFPPPSSKPSFPTSQRVGPENNSNTGKSPDTNNSTILPVSAVSEQPAQSMNSMTTFVTNSSECDCVKLCSSVLVEDADTSTMEPKDMMMKVEHEREIQRIEQELKINKKTFSSYKRKLDSAPDHRPSAMGMGYIAVLVLVGVVGGIVILDFGALKHDFLLFVHNLKRMRKLGKKPTTSSIET